MLWYSRVHGKGKRIEALGFMAGGTALSGRHCLRQEAPAQREAPLGAEFRLRPRCHLCDGEPAVCLRPRARRSDGIIDHITLPANFQTDQSVPSVAPFRLKRSIHGSEAGRSPGRLRAIGAKVSGRLRRPTLGRGRHRGGRSGRHRIDQPGAGGPAQVKQLRRPSCGAEKPRASSEAPDRPRALRRGRRGDTYGACCSRTVVSIESLD